MLDKIGRKELEQFIQLSLAVTFLRILLTLVTKGFGGSLGLVGGHIVALAMLFGQIYFLAKRQKWAWILSALQVLVLISTGRGSFGYVINYLWEPLATFSETHGITQELSYLQTGILIAAECAKTFFMYFIITKRPQGAET
jgi:hypothetical protein